MWTSLFAMDARGAARAAALLLVPLSLGCGELTSGGVGTGEGEVYVTGDEDGGSPAAARSAATVTPAHAGSAGASALPTAAATAERRRVEGTVTVGLRVWLEAPEGGWVELTQGVQAVTVAADGSDEARVAVKVVAAGRYPRVRAAFTRAEADVRGGLVIDGLPLVGQVRVGIAQADTVVVEAVTPVVVPEDGSAAVLVDLNAETWLRSASLLDRRVAAAAFRGAVRLTSR